MYFTVRKLCVEKDENSQWIITDNEGQSIKTNSNDEVRKLILEYPFDMQEDIHKNSESNFNKKVIFSDGMS